MDLFLGELDYYPAIVIDCQEREGITPGFLRPPADRLLEWPGAFLL
jgi:hypothetical protein